MPSMEPRQRPRAKGPQFPHHELASILYACGDHHTPLPDTVNCLDEIITDYVIEMCHEADLHARNASRSKVKVDDFQFALRHDARKLGRIVELLEANRAIQRKRDMFKNQSTAKGEAAAAAGVGGVASGPAGNAGDDDVADLAQLVESGMSKKGKAKALREMEAAARETAAAAAARRRALETEADMEADLDVDADGDIDMD